MKFEKKITLTVLIALFACQNQSTYADDPKIITNPVTQANITGTEPGWRPMTKDDFVNGNCSDDTWSFESNTIKCTGKPVGVIRTKKQITNLELVVEWKHKQYGGNSGVFLWATPDSIKRLEEGKGRLPTDEEMDESQEQVSKMRKGNGEWGKE